MSERPLVERLVRLFGPQWQAALDHSGVLSRRRAREFGAGADPTPLMLAMVELLENCPRTHWPQRWRRLADRFPGKTSDTCPTLDAFADRLHPDGRIDPRDAVFVWDRAQDEATFRNTNVAVGMLPAALHSRPPSDSIHERWRRWNEQWDSAHGGAMLNARLEEEEATPEGVLAGWIASGRLRASDAAAALSEAERRIFGFSRDRVAVLERRLQEKRGHGMIDEMQNPYGTVSGQQERARANRAGRSGASRH